MQTKTNDFMRESQGFRELHFYLLECNDWFEENDLLEQVNTGIVPIKDHLETLDSLSIILKRVSVQFLPHRRKITVVFGEPIDCGDEFDKDSVNSQEFRNKVDEIHSIYLQRLQELYDTNKSKYELPGSKPMTFK